MKAIIKTTSGTKEIDVNLKKTGSDPDVINAWVQDEFEIQFKEDIGVDSFEVVNMDKLIAEAKKLEEVT